MLGLIAHIRRGPIKKNNSHKEVVLPKMNGQTEKVLSITDILKQMSGLKSLVSYSQEVVEDIAKSSTRLGPIYANPEEISSTGPECNYLICMVAARMSSDISR